METFLNSLKNLLEVIVNFYSEHKSYFDLAQFAAGFIMLFI